MIHRLLLIFFLTTIINLPTSLFATESNNPQNSISNKQPLRVNNFKINHTYGDVKNMASVPAPTIKPAMQAASAITSESIKPESLNPSLNKEENRNAIDENKAETDQKNKNDLNKIYVESYEELNGLVRYVSFGILIALFYMCNNSKIKRRFLIKNKCLFTLSSLSSILSLFLNYIGTAYQLFNSEKLLTKQADRAGEGLYELKIISDHFWYLKHFILFVALIVFLRLAYKYFIALTRVPS